MKQLTKKFFLLFVYAYLYIPIFILIFNSFNADRYGLSLKGFTWNWYESLLNNDNLIQATLNSLIVAACAAFFATILGGLISIALYRYKFTGKSFVSVMLFIVMMSPDIVMAVSLLSLFILIGLPLGFWSLLLAHVTFCTPFVVIIIYARLKGYDSKMVEAAKDLGASELTILRKITIPLCMPAIISSWLLSFTVSLDDVIISSFVSGVSYDILPLRIYSMVKVGVTPEINALATIMISISIILVIISQLILYISRKKAPNHI